MHLTINIQIGGSMEEQAQIREVITQASGGAPGLRIYRPPAESKESCETDTDVSPVSHRMAGRAETGVLPVSAEYTPSPDGRGVGPHHNASGGGFLTRDPGPALRTNDPESSKTTPGVVTDVMARTQVTSPDPADPAAPGIYLGDLLDDLRPRAGWSDSTASDYASLVRRWEAYHGGRGPDVRQIRDDDFLSFAQSVEAWRSRRSLAKNWTYYHRLLRSGAPRAAGNPLGRPPGEAVLGCVPYCRLPAGTDCMDVDRYVSYLEPLDVDAIGRLHAACDSAEVFSPDVWRAQIVLLWFYGLRRDDLLGLTWSNFTRGYLAYKEAKRSKPVVVPIAAAVSQHLERLPRAAGDDRIFAEIRDWHRRNPMRSLYPELGRIYSRAGVEPLRTGGRRLWYHGLRSACVSAWKAHAPGYQRFVTGHARNDVSDDHYARVNQHLRAKVKTYPCPPEFEIKTDYQRRLF